MLSDEKLNDAYEAAAMRGGSHADWLRAVAEAAVRAEREGAAPVAFLIDWPDEPGLGHYFAEASCETGRSRPLYLHPPQASATVPEGMVLVPIEPTESMLESARLATESEGLTTTTWLRNCVYRAMLAAGQRASSCPQNAETRTRQPERVEETLQNEHVCVPEGWKLVHRANDHIDILTDSGWVLVHKFDDEPVRRTLFQLASHVLAAPPT